MSSRYSSATVRENMWDDSNTDNKTDTYSSSSDGGTFVYSGGSEISTPSYLRGSSYRMTAPRTYYDLIAAVGVDMTPHNAEIDTIPCAGIIVSFGPLKGRLAWRLVVKISKKDNIKFPKKEVWAHPQARSDYSMLSVSPQQLQAPLIPQKPPIKPLLKGFTGVVVNFILDTSQYTSIVPRETLHALGFEPRDVYPGLPVRLSVQGIDTHVYVGMEGEAGRLGVQYLKDSNAAVVIDKEAGPLMFVERRRNQDIPKTVK